jgi:hypothetical protein
VTTPREYPLGRAPADTSADAWHAQLTMLRRFGGTQRLAIALRLTGLARETTRAGIRARHPEYGDGEVRRAFFRLLHGDAAALSVWPGHELLEP